MDLGGAGSDTGDVRSVDDTSLGESDSGLAAGGDLRAALSAARSTADRGEALGEAAGAGLERVERAVESLGSAAESVLDVSPDEMAGARMFAHEVNNLVMAISGRAQRGLISGDEHHVREALEMAADIGGRVAGLCALFLGETGGGGDHIRNRQIGLCQSQIIDVHGFGVSCVAGHPVCVGDGVGVEFECDLEGVDDASEEWGDWGVGMPGMLLGQVLMNLYGNALTGIGRAGVGEDGIERAGVVRLRGGWGDDGGAELVVEDSGVGFGVGGGVEERVGGALGVEFGGYGLGLGVCRALVGGFGGRIELGRSDDLGGGLVRLIFE